MYSWFANYPWLVYSKVVDDCFCLPCMLFGLRSGHIAAKQIRLVSEPLIYWTSVATLSRDHDRSMLHHNAVLQMKDFEKMMQNQICDIHIQ